VVCALVCVRSTLPFDHSLWYIYAFSFFPSFPQPPPPASEVWTGVILIHKKIIRIYSWINGLRQARYLKCAIVIGLSEGKKNFKGSLQTSQNKKGKRETDKRLNLPVWSTRIEGRGQERAWKTKIITLEFRQKEGIGKENGRKAPSLPTGRATHVSWLVEVKQQERRKNVRLVMVGSTERQEERKEKQRRIKRNHIARVCTDVFMGTLRDVLEPLIWKGKR